jgi:hypothetical protein
LACLAGYAQLLACGGSETGPPPAPPKLADAVNTAAQLRSLRAPAGTNLFESFALFSMLFSVAGNSPYLPILAPAALGKTFVWDTTSQRYVASSDPGAPVNGVRFVLYDPAANGPTIEPARPFAALGYVDLTDRSVPGTTVLAVSLVGTQGLTPVTYAGYTVSGEPGATVSRGSIAGYVTDGATRLELLSTRRATCCGDTTHTTANVAAQGVHLDETSASSWSATTDVTAADFVLTSEGETVRANGAVTIESLYPSGSIAVTVNGRAFATITVGRSGLSYAGAPGVVLDAADQAALLELYFSRDALRSTAVVLLFAASALRL